MMNLNVTIIVQGASVVQALLKVLILVHPLCVKSPFFIKNKGGFRRPYQCHLYRYFDTEPPTPFSLSLACAAASRAMGTRYGEQLT